jgi:hypothetical protein
MIGFIFATVIFTVADSNRDYFKKKNSWITNDPVVILLSSFWPGALIAIPVVYLTNFLTKKILKKYFGQS